MTGLILPRFSGKPANDSGNSGSNSDSRELLHRIQQLSFREFKALVFWWLGASGFKNIQSLGRKHQRGRRQCGGVDFVATLPGSAVRVVIQIRHWRTPLQHRVVDELRAVLLRSGIPGGLLVTNASASEQLKQRLNDYPGRPVQIIDGAGLAGSLAWWAEDNTFWSAIKMVRLASDMEERKEKRRLRSPRTITTDCAELVNARMEESSPAPSSGLVWFVLVSLILGIIIFLTAR